MIHDAEGEEQIHSSGRFPFATGDEHINIPSAFAEEEEQFNSPVMFPFEAGEEEFQWSSSG